ncbi:pancreatic secretory granule membrane major glycoprotein GP2-like [Aplochiton taeniatus]
MLLLPTSLTRCALVSGRWTGERGTRWTAETAATNSTHAVYSNSLFVYPVQNVSLGHSQRNTPSMLPLSIPFSCAYPLETESNLNVPIQPYLRLDGVVGVGSKAPASMSLFHNSNYTEPYPEGPVSLPLGSTLYVGVLVEERDSSFVVVLEDCFATHSPDSDGPVKYFLVQNKCPSQGSQVTVHESGSSLQARFSALLFLYQGDYQDVFLHCSLSLCDQRSSSCSPVCSRRRSRSAFKSNPLKPLTIGPITWGKKLG